VEFVSFALPNVLANNVVLMVVEGAVVTVKLEKRCAIL